MNNDYMNDKGQFRMRLDQEEPDRTETVMPHQVDDLRLEKLNHRVTLISILIPVLIAAVVIIGYMDIKKRVIQTEDTGQLTAESLSKELESRFESLTMAQKVVEENLSRLKDQSDKSVAKVQINLKKLDDQLKRSNKKMVSQKDMKTTKNKIDQRVNNVAKSIDELKLQLGQFTETLQPRISELEKLLKDNKSRMADLEAQLTALDTNKIDKSKMDVALKLEMLKVKQSYKAQLEDLQSRIKAVESKSVPQKTTPTPITPSPSPSRSPSSVTPESRTKPSPSTTPLPGRLEEQNINK